MYSYRLVHLRNGQDPFNTPTWHFSPGRQVDRHVTPKIGPSRGSPRLNRNPNSLGLDHQYSLCVLPRGTRRIPAPLSVMERWRPRSRPVFARSSASWKSPALTTRRRSSMSGVWIGWEFRGVLKVGSSKVPVCAPQGICSVAGRTRLETQAYSPMVAFGRHTRAPGAPSPLDRGTHRGTMLCRVDLL